MGARRCLSTALLVAAGLMPVAAAAATLQISPVMVEFQTDENASRITLRNPGDRPLYGQVRVFRWDQADGEDTLAPTQDLIASPPLMQMGPRTDQLVRLVWAGGAPLTVEQSFRVLIDELPQPSEAPTSGVTFRLRYSVPVFVEPVGAMGQPQLAWRLEKTTKGWTMRVENTGTRRAQLASVQLVNGAGKVYVINKGLLGYALAGRAGQWTIALPPDVDLSGTVKVRAAVNSLPVEATVTMKQSS